MAEKQTGKRHRSSEKAGESSSQGSRASLQKEKILKLNAVTIFVKEAELREQVMDELKDELREEAKKELKEELREPVIKELKEELREPVIKELKEEHRESVIKELKEEHREEFRKAPQTDQGKQPRFRLKIMSKVDEVVYEGSNINKRDCIEVVMLDHGNPIAPDHPLASAKVELVLLDELFEKPDEDCWTTDDFNAHIIRPRKGKSEIGNVNQETETIIRNCTFHLTGGRCCHEGVRIKKTSKRKLVRLGVKYVGRTEERVLEGVLSEPFKVQERKTKENAKHPIPSLDDDIWRLHGIAKNSKACLAIQEGGMNTVGDLLSLYCEDGTKLHNILKDAYHHDSKVEDIIKHAKHCGDGLCTYEEGDVELFFNFEDQLVGAQISRDYHKLAELEEREKDRAITLSKTAKDNKNSWRGVYKMEDDLPKRWQPRSLGPNSAQPTSVQMLNNVQCSTGGDQQQTFWYGRGNSTGLPPDNLDVMLSLSRQTPVQMVQKGHGNCMVLPSENFPAMPPSSRQTPSQMMQQGGAGYYQQEGFRDRHEPQTSQQMVMQNTSSQIMMQQNVQGSTGGGQQQTFWYGHGNSMVLPSENFDAMPPSSRQTPIQTMEQVQGGASFAQDHNQSGSVQSFHTARQHYMTEPQPLGTICANVLQSCAAWCASWCRWTKSGPGVVGWRVFYTAFFIFAIYRRWTKLGW